MSPSPNVMFGTKPSIHLGTTVVEMAKKKGFGKNVQTKKETPAPVASEPVAESKPTPVFDVEEESTSSLSGGQEALARLRRAEVEKRNEELRAVRELKQMDDMLVDNPDAAVIPEKVAMRMGKRMLPFVGIPLFGSLGAFVAFWYFATQKDVVFQPTLVAFSTIFVLVLGLLGITYSVMSASWDPDVEGSTIGAEEFKKNLSSIQDGFKRSRENTLLREKMAGLPEEEISRAIRDMERKEEKEMEDKMTLQQKLEKDLE